MKSESQWSQMQKYRLNCPYRISVSNAMHFKTGVSRGMIACWRSCPGSEGAIMCLREEKVGTYSVNGKRHWGKYNKGKTS